MVSEKKQLKLTHKSNKNCKDAFENNDMVFAIGPAGTEKPLLVLHWQLKL